MTPRAWMMTAALAAGLAGATAVSAETTPGAAPAPDAATATSSGKLEHLVPAMAGSPYRLEPGERPYLHRFAVTPGFGQQGTESLFSLRLSYYPNSWLGYEGMIGHIPSHSVQAIVDRFALVVRKPLPGRFQPYATGGYGMTIVLPGRSINADPVTKNALSYGGGLELFVRSDLALRAELLGTTVIGRQQDRQGPVAYDYREGTIALTFYRTLRP